MSIVTPTAAAGRALGKILNDGANRTLRLFTNNYVPLVTSNTSDFTEPTGTGYAPITLANGSWTVDANTAPATGTYANQTWTITNAFSGNASAYGYFVLDANNTLEWAERFASPFTPVSGNNTCVVSPKYQASNGTPS